MSARGVQETRIVQNRCGGTRPKRPFGGTTHLHFEVPPVRIGRMAPGNQSAAPYPPHCFFSHVGGPMATARALFWQCTNCMGICCRCRRRSIQTGKSSLADRSNRASWKNVSKKMGEWVVGLGSRVVAHTHTVVGLATFTPLWSVSRRGTCARV
jgi:hypothetical protein